MNFIRTVLAVIGIVASFAALADPVPPVTPPPRPRPPSTIAEAIAGAEKSGALPVLNRDDTLSGPDVDGNGIRDDIDAWIATLPDTPAQKTALRQEAAAIQAAVLVDTANSAALERARAGVANAVNCVGDRYPNALADDREPSVKKYTVNTKARFLAYGKFNAALNGSASAFPKGDTCVQ